MAEGSDVLIPGLPNEIAIFCMAQAPRTNHHKMRGVCQSWQSLMRGQDFWEARRILSLTEEWLYLYGEIGNTWRCFDPASEKWLRLSAMPHDNRIPGHSAFASMDGKIFVIGGNLLSFYDADESYVPCRTVSYFDVRSYGWKRAADLNIARAKCMVGIINNQIYAFGGYLEGFESTTITAEAYDPITNTWRFISSLQYPIARRDSVVIGGKWYAVGKEAEPFGVVYDAETDKWEDMAMGLESGWEAKTTILNGKLYTVGHEYVSGTIENYEANIHELLQSYDPSKDVWEIVKESSDWPVLILSGGVELVSFRGMLCIISTENNSWFDKDEQDVICMVILEVDSSIENHTCSLNYQKDFHISIEDEEIPLSREIKRCQVVAL